MIKSFQVQRLRVGTLFCIYLVGAVMTLYPLMIVVGILTLCGYNVMESDGRPMHGLEAVAWTFVGPLVGGILFALNAILLTWPGLWLFSKFKPLTIWYYAAKAPPIKPVSDGPES